MAKCVVCTYLNADREFERHPNSTTFAVVKALSKRAKTFNTKQHSHKFCEGHGVGGKGAKTGLFKPHAVNLPIPFSTRMANEAKTVLVSNSTHKINKGGHTPLFKRPIKPEIPDELVGKFRKNRTPSVAI